jgi:uncharacterized protein (DUF2147 family)
MKKIQFILLILLVLCLNISFANEALLGNWTVLDNKTGQPSAVVELISDGDTIKGQIIKLFSSPEEKCINCPGEFKDQPLNNMIFLWGLKPLRHDKWGGGTILDPHTGKIYSAQLKLIKNKLYVRSYVGMTLLGKTQIWKR